MIIGKEKLSNQNTIKIQQYDDNKWQVSSAKYSDLSSMQMDKSKHILHGYEDYNDLISPVIAKNKTNNLSKTSQKCDADFENVRLDSQQFTQYFYEQDSLLSLGGVMPEQQFRMFARQLQIDPMQRQTIAYKFYKKNKQKNPGFKPDYLSKYYLDYLQWKQRPQQLQYRLDNKQNEVKIDIFKNVKQKMINKQLQLQSYRSHLQKQMEQRSYKEMKDKLKDISEEYRKKMQVLLAKKQEIQESLEVKQKEKGRQLGFEKIEYPEIKAINYQKMESNGRRALLQKQKQINGRSFVDLIKRPPRNEFKDNISFPKQDIPFSEQNYNQRYQKPTNMKKEKLPQQQQTESKKQKQFGLNIGQILKMPHRQFLLFYNHYESKIAALTTPQEMRQLNQYRRQALERAEVIEKLKRKIYNSDGTVIERLSPDKKQKLFKILYEQDVQKQRNK